MNPTVSLRGLSKSFGGSRALVDVSLDFAPGEIHGLLGQNGSGKSTLIKVLSGYHEPDSGTAVVRGQALKLPLSPRELRRLRIEFVHQDLGLAPTMSILENLRIGRYTRGLGGRIRWRAERHKTRELLRRFELSLDPNTRVSQLSQAERSIVAIMRAVQDVEEREEPGLLVLDEPTASLPANEVEMLFVMMRRVAAWGWAVLFVTHDVGEVFAITHRVSVLRDGRHVATRRTSDLDEAELVRLIIGRDLGALYPDTTSHAAGTVVQVRGLSGKAVEDVSFDVLKGEILGITGLVGAGYDELPYLIFGAHAPQSGVVVVGKETIASPNPVRSKRVGVALLPADRHELSAVPRATVKENVTMPWLRSFSRGLRLDHRAERTSVEQVLNRFQVRPPDPERPLFTLSGGNQQKALLARWIEMRPKVLMLHEPTQGVDVGARQGIFEILRDAAGRGTSIIYASVEYEDLARVCDRVLVFRRGRLAANLSGDALTHDQILAQCYQPARDGVGS